MLSARQRGTGLTQRSAASASNQSKKGLAAVVAASSSSRSSKQPAHPHRQSCTVMIAPGRMQTDLARRQTRGHTARAGWTTGSTAVLGASSRASEGCPSPRSGILWPPTRTQACTRPRGSLASTPRAPASQRTKSTREAGKARRCPCTRLQPYRTASPIMTGHGLTLSPRGNERQPRLSPARGLDGSLTVPDLDTPKRPPDLC
jgi:hypothetical protein